MPAAPPSCARACSGMADDGGFNAAFALLDRKSTVDVLGPQEVELWRGRMRTRALEADSQRGVQVPVDVSMPPDANWNAGLSAFTAATWPRPRAASSWWPMPRPTRPRPGRCRPVSFWAARANLLAGNPQKFAPYLKRAALHGRTFYGLVAQKVLGMQIEPDWNVPPLDRRATDDAAQRPRRPPRAGAAAARRGDGGRARAVRRLDRRRSAIHRDGHGGRPEGRRCPRCRSGSATPTGTSATTSRAMTARCIPLPPWQPAGGFSLDRALV